MGKTMLWPRAREGVGYSLRWLARSVIYFDKGLLDTLDECTLGHRSRSKRANRKPIETCSDGYPVSL